MTGPRERSRFGPWAAAGAVAAVALAVPLLGSWAAADKADPQRASAPPEEPDRPPAAAESRQDPQPPQRTEADRGASRRDPAADPADRVAIGAYIPHATRRPGLIRRYARMTGRRPAIVAYYRKWREGRVFDRRTLRRTTRDGAVPMITWEPWRQPLRDIAAGRYDAYIRASARDARRWKRPILLRFAHEMNGDWYPWGAHENTPHVYRRAWRQVVRVFRDAGADNVRFVWTPNVDYGGLPLMRRLYPGDRWVDWVGLSGFSWGGPWEWESALDVFRNSYRSITRMTSKPFMIAETAAGEVGGDKPRWIQRTFAHDLRRMPLVRALVWFNGRQEWADWDVDSTRASLRAFRSAVASPRYAGTAADVIEQGGRDR